jgi:hypothetical protein
VNARIQRLRAEVASDARAFDARVDEIATLPSLVVAPRSTLAQAAVSKYSFTRIVWSPQHHCSTWHCLAQLVGQVSADRKCFGHEVNLLASNLVSMQIYSRQHRPWSPDYRPRDYRPRSCSALPLTK